MARIMVCDRCGKRIGNDNDVFHVSVSKRNSLREFASGGVMVDAGTENRPRVFMEICRRCAEDICGYVRHRR